MPTTTNPPFWKTVSFYVAVLSLVLSGISLYSSIYGFEGYELRIDDRIAISNQVEGIVITPVITINNNGTKVLTINKIEGFLLKNGSVPKNFETVTTININAKNIWSNGIVFFNRLEDTPAQVRTSFIMNAKKELMQEYQKVKNDDNLIPFPKESKSYDQAGTLLKENSDWITRSKDYKFLLMFWINDAGAKSKPSELRLYNFELTEEQTLPLKQDQLTSWKAPFEETFKSNKFLTYYATPTMTEITDEGEINKIYDAYPKKR